MRKQLVKGEELEILIFFKKIMARFSKAFERGIQGPLKFPRDHDF